MAGEISSHPLNVSMILSRVQFIGSPIPILLIPVITEMDFSNFFRATVLYVRRVLFESGTSFESDDAFIH